MQRCWPSSCFQLWGLIMNTDDKKQEEDVLFYQQQNVLVWLRKKLTSNIHLASLWAWTFIFWSGSCDPEREEGQLFDRLKKNDWQALSSKACRGMWGYEEPLFDKHLRNAQNFYYSAIWFCFPTNSPRSLISSCWLSACLFPPVAPGFIEHGESLLCLTHLSEYRSDSFIFRSKPNTYENLFLTNSEGKLIKISFKKSQQGGSLCSVRLTFVSILEQQIKRTSSIWSKVLLPGNSIENPAVSGGLWFFFKLSVCPHTLSVNVPSS